MAFSSRTFEPWVGALYWKEGFVSLRILILGESHYGEAGTECPSFTREAVEEWGQKRRNRFFTVVQKLISDIPIGVWVSDEERKSFWEHVAFYNFIQSFPGDLPRERPTTEMWTAAQGSFVATVQELQPHLIVVLGFDLARNLPSLPSDVTVCDLQHPSSRGFRCTEWQEKVRSAIAEVSTRVAAQQGAPRDALKAARP